ncbi:MAG: hypothetical protein Q9175_006918, partial [Cornicularia normoerica]
DISLRIRSKTSAASSAPNLSPSASAVAGSNQRNCANHGNRFKCPGAPFTDWGTLGGHWLPSRDSFPVPLLDEAWGMVAISSFEETQMMAFSVGRMKEPGGTFCGNVSPEAWLQPYMKTHTEAFDPMFASLPVGSFDFAQGSVRRLLFRP